jgi:hypothetical protein
MTGRQPNATDALRRRSAVSSSHQNARTEGYPPRKSLPKRFERKVARAMKCCQAGFTGHSLTPQFVCEITVQYQYVAGIDMLTPGNHPIPA